MNFLRQFYGLAVAHEKITRPIPAAQNGATHIIPPARRHVFSELHVPKSNGTYARSMLPERAEVVRLFGVVF